MLKVGLKDGDFITVTHSEGLKTFNLNTEFVDDAPSDDLLASDPSPSLLIIRLPKEELEVEQVAEAAALEELHLHSWQQGHLLF